MSQNKADTRRVGICWADPETFWWNATDEPVCPACSEDDTDYQQEHGFFVPESRLGRAVEALNLALMHLEDERAIAAVRAVLAEQEKEQA